MKKITFMLLSLMILAGGAFGGAFATAVPAPTPNPSADFFKAVKEFRNLPRSEKKARIKEVKKQLKEFRKAKREGAERPDKTVLIILAILLPPLAVYLHQQEVNNKFWISLLLTLLFWLPGVIYALVVVLDADS